MRLLFIDFTLPYLLKDANYPVGGWAVELEAWLRALSAAGHDCAVLSWKGSRAYAGEQSGIALLDTYDPADGIPIAKYAYSYIPKLCKVARAWRPDAVVQGMRGIQTLMMAMVGDVLGVPFAFRVVSDADVDERYKIGLAIQEQLAYLYGLRRTAALICQNQYQHDYLARLFPNKPVHILHAPYDLPAGVEAVRPCEDRRYVAWLGVFRYPKNLPLLCKVAQAVPQITFRLGGMPSQQLDRETAQALALLHTLPNVEFAGYVKRQDVGAFLAGAVMLLCSSHYEGFSLTFLESLAMGTPIVTRRTVDPDHIVHKHGLGASVEADADLPAAVQALWEATAPDYLALAGKCRAYIAANHRPEAKGNDFAALFRPLVRPSRID